MNKKLLEDINRNRKLMGLNESEVDEQILKSFRDGIKMGYNKAKEFVKDKVINPVKDKVINPVKDKVDTVSDYEKETEKKYNGTPIIEIIDKIKKTNKNYGTVEVKGETLYFGIGKSTDREIAQKISISNVELSFSPKENIRTSNNGETERTVADHEVKGGLGTDIIEFLEKNETNVFISYKVRKK